MRNMTASQQQSYSGDTLTIASLVDITLRNGQLIKLTDHDRDLGAYKSAFGVDVSAITMQLGASGQTASISVLPDNANSGGISIDMVESGALDNAKVVCKWVDYTKVYDALPIFTGYVNDIKYGNSSLFEISIASRLTLVQPLCKDQMSQNCRADFGDPTCGVPIGRMQGGGTVDSAVDDFSMTTQGGGGSGKLYNNGTVYFTSGNNAGLGYEILTIRGNLVVTKDVWAFPPEHGDSFELHPGCDKVFDSGCKFWNNQKRFQGEPFVSADDFVYRGGLTL